MVRTGACARLSPMHQPIEDDEEVAPAEQTLAVTAQTQDGIGAAANEQLIDSLLSRNLLVWLFGVDDRQRNKNGAGPGRNLVDVEVEPVGKRTISGGMAGTAS